MAEILRRRAGRTATVAEPRRPAVAGGRGRWLGVDSRHQASLVSNVDTMARPSDLLPGTLDLLILRTLQKDALHGWAISERIQEISEDVLQVKQGSLYPALHRLEHQGWIGSRVDGVGAWPPRQVLPAHDDRPATPRRRDPRVGSHVERHRPGHEAGIGPVVNLRDLKLRLRALLPAPRRTGPRRRACRFTSSAKPGS